MKIANLGNVLQFKFGKNNGCVTVNDELYTWNAALGPKPSDTELQAYASDYEAQKSSLKEHAEFDQSKLVKAVAIWTAQKLNIPVLTAKAEILAIYRVLP